MCYLSIFAKYILKAHSGLKVGRKNWWHTRFSFDTFSQPSSFKSFTVDLEWKCLKCAQRWRWKMSPFIFQSSCFREPLSASFFNENCLLWCEYANYIMQHFSYFIPVKKLFSLKTAVCPTSAVFILFEVKEDFDEETLSHRPYTTLNYDQMFLLYIPVLVMML